jgi:hypothetical protein
MNTKKKVVRVLSVVALACIFFMITQRNCEKWRFWEHTFPGKTPLALEKSVPDGLTFSVVGKDNKVFTYTSKSFRALAKARVRTPEITPEGEMLGAYYYTGIPLLYIMEGFDDLKTKKDAFDRPLDMIVVFQSKDGKTVRFSYGELVMCSDSLPIMLAYDREPVKPFKNPEAYTKNKIEGNVTGLRLVCPREKDNARFLDNVVNATFVLPQTPDDKLPKMQKNIDCQSTSIICIEDNTEKPATFESVAKVEYTDWFRIGHGRGIREQKLGTVSGYNIRDFLKMNFTITNLDDFYLVIACDGYRSIYSAREIFNTAAGNGFLLYDKVDDEIQSNGMTWGAVTDFFMDRCVKSVTHIIRIDSKGLK